MGASVRYILLPFCVLIGMFAGPALAQPPALSITQCQKISKPGVYLVQKNLTQGAPTSDCLTISAAGVTLNLNGQMLKGSGSGDGIHVLSSASKAFIEGADATIEGFGEGIEVDGANAFVENFTVEQCSDAGVLLKNAHQAYVGNFATHNNLNDGVHVSGGTLNTISTIVSDYNNGRYGVWIESSSHNTLTGFDIRDNSIAGVFLGCSSGGPGGGLCASHAPPSNYNAISDGSATTNSTSPIQQYGIAIDKGDNFNKVAYSSATFNSIDSLYDANEDCGEDFYGAVSYSLPSSACVQN